VDALRRETVFMVVAASLVASTTYVLLAEQRSRAVVEGRWV